jgi:hypothetical protein
MFALSRFEWLVVAAALLLCPGFSWGADPEGSLFDRLDKNRDGSLSKEELSAPEAQTGNWMAIDRNRDGRITRDEFDTRLARQPQPNAAAGGTQAPSKPEPGKQE